VLSLALVACGGAPPPDRPAAAREIPAPAGAASTEPNLTVGPDGRFWLTWIEPGPAGGGHVLRAAHRRPGGAWSGPIRIAEGADWFVNWADFPSVAALADGSLAAHWLVKRPSGGPYGYDVHVSRSRDGGATWSAPVTPHRDGTASEHGFVSLYPAGAGLLGVVWLDGRKFPAAEADHAAATPAEMTLRHARLGPDGTLSEEIELDGRVCDCCQTAAIDVVDRVLVAYRDRSSDEIRDISLVRYRDGRWSEPEAFSNDGWKIAGCPVNGPSLAASGRDVALAWFAAPGDTARVRVAVSRDGGDTFAAATVVDDGEPLGRVDVEMLDGGRALVSWLESASGQAQVRLRIVGPDAPRGASFSVAATAASRSSGFPRLARSGAEALVAWTDAGEPSRVRTAVVDVR
jgi:hypothetical protein